MNAKTVKILSLHITEVNRLGFYPRSGMRHPGVPHGLRETVMARVGRQMFEFTSFVGGKTEVYEVHEGMATFTGYMTNAEAASLRALTDKSVLAGRARVEASPEDAGHVFHRFPALKTRKPKIHYPTRIVW